MKPSEILIKAKSLIDTPQKWTQGEYAKSEKGRRVQPTSPRATCFCSVGAVLRATGSKDEFFWMIDNEQREEAIDILSEAMNVEHVPLFNDTHTHAEVMAAWDEAIKLAKEKENEQV